jgi:hypothetical protein
MLVGADALYTTRRVVVLRHHRTDADVRQRILAMAVDRGAAPEWRSVANVSAIAWPLATGAATTRTVSTEGDAELTAPYSLIITGPHELVLAPTDELPRIAEVAADHAARRDAGADTLFEPELLGMRTGEVLTATMTVPPPARQGYPEPPQSMRLEVDQNEAGHIGLAIASEFATESEAMAARQWLTDRATFYGQQMMVRAIGMNRPLEEARFEVQGSHLDVSTHLTTDELRRLLGLLALSQTSSG